VRHSCRLQRPLVRTSNQVGDKVCERGRTEKWFEENDPEGVAFEYSVIGSALRPSNKLTGRFPSCEILLFAQRNSTAASISPRARKKSAGRWGKSMIKVLPTTRAAAFAVALLLPDYQRQPAGSD
jgi:hypothetical protein